MQRPVLFSLILLIFSLPQYSFATTGNLHGYLKKYSSIHVSTQQMRRLAKYSHLIRYYSNFSFFKVNHKVSPYFIQALILAESACDPYAVSAKNAFGLGQIQYPTGKKAAMELYKTGRFFRYINPSKLKHLKQEDLFDPAINILLTCYLISKYNHRFNGKLELVVSAWNAGENVDSLKIGLPPPYSETYNLIGKINGYYISLLRHSRKL